MRDQDVGCLPVLEDHSSRRLVGVITDRDVCCRVIAEGYDPNRTAIEPYITRNLITCLPDDDLETCLQLLHKHGLGAKRIDQRREHPTLLAQAIEWNP